MGRHSPRNSRWRRAVRLARAVWLLTVLISSVVVVIDKVGASGSRVGAISPPRPVETVTQTPAPTPSPEPTVAPPPSPDAISPPAGPLTPVYDRINTKNNVVFVTMDDGYLADQRVLNLIRDNHLPVTLFLVSNAAKAHKDYFTQMVAAGATVENHTVSHPLLTKMSYDAQVKQICGAAEQTEKLFGYRPVLFRPPYGSYNDTTRRAAHHCGMKAMFTWSASMNFGYIAVADKNLSAGEVILMHFRPDTFDNLTNLLKELKKRNLTVGRLEDYVGTPKG